MLIRALGLKDYAEVWALQKELVERRLAGEIPDTVLLVEHPPVYTRGASSKAPFGVLPHPLHSIESVMDHFTYCVDVMGIEHVAFGPDTFFGDHVALARFYAAALDSGEVSEHESVEYVEGLESPTEYPNIVRWLVGHGYTDEQIAMVMGGNILRAMGEVWV